MSRIPTRSTSEWLDEKIKEQKHNTEIMERVSKPMIPAELQEQAEVEGFEE